MGERNLVLSSDLVSNDDLIDVIKLIPVFLLILMIPEQSLELRASWDRHVEGFRSEKTPLVE